MKFSLIVATIRRTDEMHRLLESLEAQTRRDFEVIVVDQNPDDRLVPILDRFTGVLDLHCIRCPRGLSRARNAGLKLIMGDVVAFPDDDCWYPGDLLQRVAEYLESNPRIDGLTGRAVDGEGRNSSARWSTSPGILSDFSLFSRGISIGIFLRRKVVDRVGGFDESLGLGSGTPWGSGEESDYLIRAVNRGFAVMYRPDLVVFHDDKTATYDETARQRAYSYSMGMGRLLRKHRYPSWFFGYMCARPFGGTLIALLRGRSTRARYHAAVLRGRIEGWTAK
jgi:glycosyltransferase involved in cell wall biosynthesis